MNQHWSCTGLDLNEAMRVMLHSLSSNGHLVCNRSVHVLLTMSFIFKGLCSATALLNIFVEWSLLEVSSLPEWICYTFTSVPSMRETSFGDRVLMPFSSHPLSLLKGQNDVHLFLGQFMGGVSGLVGLSRLNRWNYLVDNQMLMPLTTSLFVFSVSRRACEVWLHCRVCHTWASLWCTKGKLYKVQSPGLCLPLGYVFSGIFSVISWNNIDHQAISEPRWLCFSFCGFFLLINLPRERCLFCLHSL